MSVRPMYLLAAFASLLVLLSGCVSRKNKPEDPNPSPDISDGSRNPFSEDPLSSLVIPDPDEEEDNLSPENLVEWIGKPAASVREALDLQGRYTEIGNEDLLSVPYLMDTTHLYTVSLQYDEQRNLTGIRYVLRGDTETIHSSTDFWMSLYYTVYGLPANCEDGKVHYYDNDPDETLKKYHELYEVWDISGEEYFWHAIVGTDPSWKFVVSVQMLQEEKEAELELCYRLTNDPAIESPFADLEDYQKWLQQVREGQIPEG